MNDSYIHYVIAAYAAAGIVLGGFTLASLLRYIALRRKDKVNEDKANDA